MTDRLFRTVLNGDVLAKWPAGGMFVSEQPELDQPRLDAREVVPAGPMFGTKMFGSRGVAAERESAILLAAGIPLDSFAEFGKLLQGTRRHNFVYVDQLNAEWEEAGLRLSFTLPAGSYATVLLRELMKARVDEDEAREND
jgi:tRNA pseudouridine13 synthase